MSSIVTAAILALALGFSAQAPMPGTRRPDQGFGMFVDDYFKAAFAYAPESGTQAGFHEWDDQASDRSRARIEARIAELKTLLARLATFDRSTLSFDDRIDADILESRARGQLLDLETLRTWEVNPMGYASGPGGSVYSLSAATVTAESPGQPPGAPESVVPGFVSARNNERKPLAHRVRNTGRTPFDVLDVQVLRRPDGPEAPAIAELAAENPRMRVYRYELDPGAASAQHTHARPYLLVAATDVTLRMTAPDGASIAHPVKAGDLHWVDATVRHTLVNDGKEKGILVEFELK